MEMQICFPRRLEEGCGEGSGWVCILAMGVDYGVWMRGYAGRGVQEGGFRRGL